MALKDLRTNLKSLRYSKDRLGGGTSNQPYIVSNIPTGDNIGQTGGPDFLLRGGLLTPGRIVKDVSRLTQMFFDFKSPNGLLFIAKQNVLSLTNVNSEAGYVPFEEAQGTGLLGSIGAFIKNNFALNQGVYTPLGTLAQTVGNGIGLHTNKQGLNPFKFKTTQGSPDGNTPLGLPTYLNTIATGGDEGNKSRLFGLLNKIDEKQNDLNLYTYSGGPGATLGVGKTNIVMIGDQRTGINNPNTTREKPKVTWGSATRFNTFANPFDVNNFSTPTSLFGPDTPGNGSPLSPANQIGSGGKTSYTIGDINISPTVNDENLSNAITNDQFLRVGASAAYLGNSFILQNANTSIKNAFLGNGKVQTFSVYEQNNDPFSLSTKNNGEAFNSGILGNTPQQQLSQEQISSKEPFSKTGKSDNITDFRRIISPQGSDNMPISLDYTRFNIEQRVNLGDPGRKGNKSSYVLGKEIPGASRRRPLDLLNALPLYKSDGVVQDRVKNDLVKFRIGVIDNNNPTQKTYIHFRAFIDSMDDNYSSDWQTVKYMGRGENFYRYNGFDRSVNLSWTVAAQSKQELIPMYQKLNYLASVCAPDYSDIGYMRGNLIELTVGGYLFNQVGIMKGITYTVPTESPWEIAIPDQQSFDTVGEGNNEIASDSSVKELPHYIKVTGFQFIPIHDFVPRLQQNDFDGPEFNNGEKSIGTFGNERYIALSNNFGNNYNINDYSFFNPPVESVGIFEPIGIQPLTQEGQGLQGFGMGLSKYLAQGFPG